MTTTEPWAPAPPPEAPNPAPRPQGTLRRWWWVIAALILLLIVAAGAWLVLGGASAAASQVHLESVSQAGPSPFTAPVGQDAPNVAAPDNASGEHPGNTGGLYAQNPDAPACDSQALLDQLQADPAKASAWVAPLGVSGDDLRGFVSGLNPVTLRSDTAVTEYGYADGQYQPYPAVLQAGTAVFINSYGEPTVKCFSGDPLGRPTVSNDSVSYVGAPWTDFHDDGCTRIVPSPAPIRIHEFINPITNIQIQQTTTVITTVNNIVLPPNPGPHVALDGRLLLNKIYDYDGTVLLSDGRILNPDGTVTAPRVSYPTGSTLLPGGLGAVRLATGEVLNGNGTPRRNVSIGRFVLHPDGTTTPPLPAGTVLRWDHDGTLVAYDQQGTRVFDRNGTPKAVQALAAGSRVNPDGSITGQDGSITNSNGTQRSSQTLRDGARLASDGSVTGNPENQPREQVQAEQGTKPSPRNTTFSELSQNQNQADRGAPSAQTGQGRTGQGQVDRDVPRSSPSQVVPRQREVDPSPQNRVVPRQNQVVPRQREAAPQQQSQAAPQQRNQVVPHQSQVVPQQRSQVVPHQSQVVPQQRSQVVPRRSQVVPQQRSAPLAQRVPTCTAQRQAAGLCGTQNKAQKNTTQRNGTVNGTQKKSRQKGH